ncbi:thioesterase family protein [Pontibaca methylaminivorans]|uniref:(3S)-malyl-CoA thioesterase n=1 Tax=Pontibaca methylaminivorans TaxID=515897 RepID=A0A1R3WGN2_9RHOB|nr:thioesterase family protein [Pontibaca methylaminivorans]SIT76576.1 (3S)-malyl-CoA thioesterase [Pontibaca methylaminivorans]
MTTDFPAPAFSSEMVIEPAWIDYNGHLNMAYYSLLFDRGSEEIYGDLGLGAEYAAATGCTTFTGAIQIRYRRELHEGDRVRARLQLLDHDSKRFHFWQELYHVDGWLAATAETLGLHVDRSGPKVAPFPPEVSARLAAMKAAHDRLGWPAGAGKAIGIGIRRNSAGTG